MFSPAELTLMYQASAAGGFIFVLYCAVTAQGAHGAHGHVSHGDAGVHGHTGMSGSSSSHALLGTGHGGGGHVSATHGPGVHAHGGHFSHAGSHAAGHAAADGANHGHGGHDSGGHATHSSESDAMQLQLQGSTGQSVTGPMHVPHKVRQPDFVEIMLGALNPMRIASFLFFFGAIGRICQILFPVMGALTIIVALAAGVAGSFGTLKLFGLFYSKSQSSSVAFVDDLVGQLAEVSVPFEHGKTGEITYVVESKRLSSPARSRVDGNFRKGDKVIIADLGANSLVYVEPWADDFQS